jgi:hypothetical protein
MNARPPVSNANARISHIARPASLPRGGRGGLRRDDTCLVSRVIPFRQAATSGSAEKRFSEDAGHAPATHQGANALHERCSWRGWEGHSRGSWSAKPLIHLRVDTHTAPIRATAVWPTTAKRPCAAGFFAPGHVGITVALLLSGRVVSSGVEGVDLARRMAVFVRALAGVPPVSRRGSCANDACAAARQRAGMVSFASL